MLLVGAGLFMRTMEQLRAVNVGFNPPHLVTFNIDPSLAGYKPAAIPAVQQRVLDGLSAIPGIRSVAASDDAALVNNGNFYGITVSRYEAPPEESFPRCRTPPRPRTHLDAMQIPLLAGRTFTDGDTLDHPQVTLVNQSFVKHFCGGDIASCLGRRISYGPANPTKVDMEIVGVFRDYRNRGIRDEIPATIYRPLRQAPDTSQIYITLRTSLEPTQAFNDIRNAMRRIDPSLAVGNMLTMDQQIDLDLQNREHDHAARGLVRTGWQTLLCRSRPVRRAGRTRRRSGHARSASAWRWAARASRSRRSS